MAAIVRLKVMRAGQYVKTIRVRAESIRDAYTRVRTERPEHARDQLICVDARTIEPSR